MKNKWMIVLFIVLLLQGCGQVNKKEAENKAIQPVIWYLPEWETKDLPENRIEILRFHHTVECEDCQMVGEMVLFLLEHTFPEEAKAGKVIYKSVNSELFENKPLLQHFEVMEEDFVINAVTGSEEIIRHDPKPLELAKQADQLHQYLEKLIDEQLLLISHPKNSGNP